MGGRDEMAAEEGAEGAGLDDGEQFEVRRWCSFELLIRIAHKSLTPVGLSPTLFAAAAAVAAGEPPASCPPRWEAEPGSDGQR